MKKTKHKTQRVIITLTDTNEDQDFSASISYEPSPAKRTVNSPSINAGVRLALLITSGHIDLMAPLVQQPKIVITDE